MADADVAAPAPAAEPAAPAAPAVAEPPKPLTAIEALQEVLKQALYADGLARGLHEVAQALGKGEAHLCVLASNCEHPDIITLIEAMCAEQKINLMKVDDRKKLGEWVGLCKIDKDGNPRKVVACSVVAVKNYGVKGQAVDVLDQHFKSNRK